MFGYQWLLLFFITSCLSAQTVKDSDNLLAEAQLLLYNNPAKSIEISEYVLGTSHTDKEKANALILLAEAEGARGNLIAVLQNLQKAELYAVQADEAYLQFKIAGLQAAQYRLLGFYEKGKQSMLVTLPSAEGEIAKGDKELLEADRFRENAFVLLNEKKNKPAIKYFRKAIIIDSQEPYNYEKKIALIKNFNDIAETYLSIKNSDSAAYFFQKTLILAQQFNAAAAFKIPAQNGLGRILFLKGNYPESVAVFSRLIESEKIADPLVKTSIYKNLSESYIALEDLEHYKLYNSRYKQLNDSILEVQKKARLFVAQVIEKEQQQSLKVKELHYYIKIIAIFLLLLLLFFGSYLYHLKVKGEYRRFLEIIGSLENGEKLKIPDEDTTTDFIDEETTVSDNSITIPESSIRAILEKLAKFEESTRYTNPNMSLQLLAKQLDTNTKYVSEIINKNKHKNFKAYINELRINYIIKKMRSDKAYLNYKTSYLAQECGFVSRSTFTTIFKSVTGLAPAKFIDFLKKEESPGQK